MKRSLTFAALITASIFTIAVSTQAAPPFSLSRPAANQLKWHTNLQSAHKIAAAENKPMLLVFGADWCHYCKKLERETLNSKEVSSYVNETFIAVHLDADKDKRVAQILKVSSLPCTIVLSPNADLLGRIEGFYTTAPYHRQLATAQQKHQAAVQASGIAR